MLFDHDVFLSSSSMLVDDEKNILEREKYCSGLLDEMMMMINVMFFFWC